MADSIGAKSYMITPTEEEIVDHFEASVYHSEQPVTTFHGAGKLILAEFVRDRGFKVVLTGEGSDEIFGGYTYFLLDYLRTIDPATVPLGFPLPSLADNAAILNTLLGQKATQDHGSISDKPQAESAVGNSMLGNLVTARTWGMISLGEEFFSQQALRGLGPVDHTLTIAEGIRPDARSKIASGEWHPLHSAMVSSQGPFLRHEGFNLFIVYNHQNDARKPTHEHCRRPGGDGSFGRGASTILRPPPSGIRQQTTTVRFSPVFSQRMVVSTNRLACQVLKDKTLPINDQRIQPALSSMDIY